MRALRQLQLTPASRRCLHITGVNSAQPANVADKASLYGARSVSELKHECQRRTLANGGTKDEVCLSPLVMAHGMGACANLRSSSNVSPTMTSCSPGLLASP